MTWLRIDDGMVDHRKWAALEGDPRTWAECLAVWVALGCYCARVSSDGFVEDARVARLTPLGAKARQRCDDLVRVGLMVREEGGYRFHGWLEYQPSAADVTRDREAARERQRKARDAAKSHRMSRRDIDRDSQSTEGVSHGPPVPSRPVPSQQRSDPADAGSASAADARVPSGVVLGAGADLTARAERARVALTEAYRSRGLVVPARSLSVPHSQEVIDIARTFADPADLARAIDGFFADARAKTAGYELRWLAARPNQYTGQARDGGRQPRPHAEYHDTPMMSFGELMRGDAAKGVDHG
jgi:hypothetical protein